MGIFYSSNALRIAEKLYNELRKQTTVLRNPIYVLSNSLIIQKESSEQQRAISELGSLIGQEVDFRKNIDSDSEEESSESEQNLLLNANNYPVEITVPPSDFKKRVYKWWEPQGPEEFLLYDPVEERRLERIALAGKPKRSEKSLLPNAAYHRFLESRYSSYWLGKFVGMFIRSGKKKLANNIINKCLLLLKYEYKQSPLLIFLEMLETLKPLFALRKYKARRTELREYPYIASNEQRYRVVLGWIKNDIMYKKMKEEIPNYNKKRKKRKRKSTKKRKFNNVISVPFYKQLFNRIVMFKNNRYKDVLINMRNATMLKSVKLQNNRRFNWRKQRRSAF